MGLALLLSASSPAAEPKLTLRIGETFDSVDGAPTWVLGTAWEGRIDFGRISNEGPHTGARVRTDGGAHYVATFELEVLAAQPLDAMPGPGDLGDASLDPYSPHGALVVSTGPTEPLTATAFDGRGWRHGGGAREVRVPTSEEVVAVPRPGPAMVYHPHDRAWSTLPTTVDLYAHTRSPPDQGGVVRIALGEGGDPSSDAGVELSLHEVAIAEGVPVGSPVRCQLSLFVPDEALGQLSTRIVFTARPSTKWGITPVVPLPGSAILH